MINNTQTNIAAEYKEYTDKYFLRTHDILKAEGINPIVRYQIFARKGGEVKGVDDAVDFVRDVAGNKAKVYALKNGDEYEPCEPLMKIEGRVQDLVELETCYLGMISGGLTESVNLEEVRLRAREIVLASQNKPIFYFGARHFHYSLDEDIAGICKEEGFAGASTDIGAKAWNSKGIGTTPHALIVSYASYMHENGIEGNATVEAAKGFDKYIDKKVPRIMLIDTFNKEIEDSIETAKAISLKGVRIDTCGENYAQGSLDIRLPKLYVPQRYLEGKGVTIPAVWALKKGLIKTGFGNLELTVSSGFNAGKIDAFMQADEIFQEKYGFPLFTNIGTGSIARPTMATSDIVAYFSEKRGKWIEMHKVGRPEIQTKRLRRIR